MVLHGLLQMYLHLHYLLPLCVHGGCLGMGLDICIKDNVLRNPSNDTHGIPADNIDYKKLFQMARHVLRKDDNDWVK